ncbi:hypothetical protein FC83_GL001320 [Agrilactobacillus composti DSM 18527 = JCM 14202]|uniref:HTH cro/C1-type domain-containing protein n=1 Tax=Agrilactobacillus composti DSM 18527 = JCM 14202 TaxID=1423734 RepID=X0PEL6_9LACO|nr:hypothetical protein [Agrilactobacillus composti]KRM35191.1 hypothetical protein FC83_GL001320 [Agrilactobacillus composti DSM 18527 = JCM 14202]GAF40174.1 hypothetical protein JCM14202_2063 [Agrilactobacillus composti DSM 18527 = JCM 14202]
MNAYQAYLDKNNLTRYAIAKASGLANSTLQRAAQAKAIDTISIKILKATALALNKKPGTVLEEILELEKSEHI